MEVTNIGVLKYGDLIRYTDCNFEYETNLLKKLIEKEWNIIDLFSRFYDPCSKIPVNQRQSLDYNGVYRTENSKWGMKTNIICGTIKNTIDEWVFSNLYYNKQKDTRCIRCGRKQNTSCDICNECSKSIKNYIKILK